MMKKLLLWSALLMTGFAFYSCDDVIDNPAQGDSTVWKCTTNVTFADFDFNGMVDPESGDAYAFEAPKTLYVFNEQLEPLGTIETETPPTAGISAKYSGNLCGVIGDNLILTTKIGTDYAKQNGTIKSVVENGIVQVAKVGVRLYSNYNHELVTYDANMENEVAIAHIEMGWLKADDEITITSENIASEDKSLTIKIGEDVNTSDLFVAIPTETSKGFDYSLSANKANGEVAGAKMEDLALEKGKINTLNKETMEPYHVGQKVLGVDLTKYDAYMRSSKDPNDAWYMNNINNGWIPSYWYGEGDDYSFIVTQSGEATLDSLNVTLGGNIDKKATITISDVRLGKDCYFEVNNGATFDITLIGENKFGMLNLNSPFAKKGTGTWEFEKLNFGGYSYWDWDKKELIVAYAAEYTIDEDMNLAHLSVANGAKLTIADGKKVNVTNETGGAISVYQATLNLGKGATLDAESKIKEGVVINIENADFNIGENAIVNAQGGKDGYAMNLQSNDEARKAEINLGKNAKVKLVGGPEGIYGNGLNIRNYTGSTCNINLEEGAELQVTGIDRNGIYISQGQWSNTGSQATVNFNIAKNAKVIAKDTEAGYGLNIYSYYSVVNFTGEGTFEAKSKNNIGMYFIKWDGNGFTSAINFKEGSFSAIGGGESPAIFCNTPFTIDEKINSFTAQKGVEANKYISIDGSEAQLEDIVADDTKFNNVTADGVRTITPKPAEE